MKIIFTGGGTGGHIYPIVAIARELKKTFLGKKLQIYYFGPKDDFSDELMSKEDIRVKRILSGKIRRYGGLAIFENIFDVVIKIPLGIIQSFFHIFFISPDLIFSKGGYGSVPTVLAGQALQVPVFLHESDIVPGASNKFLAKFVLEVFVSFPQTSHLSAEKMILVGNPIRAGILKENSQEANKEKPVILILGGSQGSERINDLIMTILPDLLKNYKVIHQCGIRNFKNVRAESEAIVAKRIKKDYDLYSLLTEQELRDAYDLADLVVSRAGSGSIFEIAAVGKPSILVPLPEAAQNHQYKNAYAYAKNDTALVIEEANLTPHFFTEKIKYLFEHPLIMENMKKSALMFAKPRAAEIIASYINEYLKS